MEVREGARGRTKDRREQRRGTKLEVGRWDRNGDKQRQREI